MKDKKNKIGYIKGDTFFTGIRFYYKNGKATDWKIKPIILKKGDKDEEE